MKNTITHLLKFFGLIAVMNILTFVPFGIFLNAAIIIAALWVLVN